MCFTLFSLFSTLHLHHQSCFRTHCTNKIIAQKYTTVNAPITTNTTKSHHFRKKNIYRCCCCSVSVPPWSCASPGLRLRPHRSKRISNAMHDITSNALNSNAHGNSGSANTYRQSAGPGTIHASSSGYGSNSSSSSSGTPRRSWSSYAFNNKNFPDGKLSYECSAASGQASSPSSVYNSSSSSASKQSSATNSGGGKQLGYGGNLSSSAASALAARNRFERSSHDVMARASQIVM